MTRPARLRSVPAPAEAPSEERTRVCGIVSHRDEEHIFRCIQAIRARVHPAWSRNFSDFRVVSRPTRTWRG
jgi:hypothetical protein